MIQNQWILAQYWFLTGTNRAYIEGGTEHIQPPGDLAQTQVILPGWHDNQLYQADEEHDKSVNFIILCLLLKFIQYEEIYMVKMNAVRKTLMVNRYSISSQMVIWAEKLNAGKEKTYITVSAFSSKIKMLPLPRW